MLVAMLGAGIVVALALLPSCARQVEPTHHVVRAIAQDGSPRLARVLLMNRRERFTLSAAAPCTVYNAVNEDPLLELRSIATTTVRPSANGIAIASRILPHKTLRVVCHRDAALTVNGARYRGHLLIRCTPAGRLDVINALPLDDYLYSVVGSETYHSWPRAAHEAQAIIARTYALWRMASRSHLHFDLYATVADQRYTGVAKEAPKIRAAVDATAGLVLLYQMKVFRCYYHSTCGGHTEAVERVFDQPPLLPLTGVACAYCGDSKYHRWSREITADTIVGAFRRAGTDLVGIRSLEVTKRTPIGGAQQLKLVTTGGGRYTYRGSEFRLVLGSQKLPSPWFTVLATSKGYQFDGRGFGHGVGLCQWGSRGMAAAGRSAAQILQHYYPGAALQRVYRSKRLARPPPAEAADEQGAT